MYKIASWNVNSLAVRLEQVLAWLDSTNVDVLLLQETKLLDDCFPKETFEALGYHVCFSGQRTYNGVAIISRHPLKDIITDMPGFVDEQRRFLAATIGDVRVINVYVPNGAAVGSDKYQYKLVWLNALTMLLQEQLSIYPQLLIAGDFNIAPEDRDVHDPMSWEGSILVSLREREAFQALLRLGFVDSFRLLTEESGHYSWWDYRAGRFRRNHGMRIDLILLSQALRRHCTESSIDIEPRRSSRPSDHAPVWVTLDMNMKA